MTARTSVRALALLTGALLVAACAGGAPTNAPAATQDGLATAAATQGPGATDASEPSFALPSLHGNVDLEKLIPASIGGEDMTTMSMTGEDFVGSGSDTDLTAVLDALNKQPADLSVAFGGNTAVQIIAFQVSGVPGSQILDAFRSAAGSTLAVTISNTTIAGKAAQKVTPTDTTQLPSYLYIKNDVVFSIAAGGDVGLTDAQLTEVFQKLP